MRAPLTSLVLAIALLGGCSPSPVPLFNHAHAAASAAPRDTPFAYAEADITVESYAQPRDETARRVIEAVAAHLVAHPAADPAADPGAPKEGRTDR